MHMTEVTIAYGMTETSPVSFQISTDDPLEKRVVDGRPGACRTSRSKIVDAAGHVVPVGEKGELCTQGYSVMHGYWADATRTAEAIVRRAGCTPATWRRIDAEGYCNIVGRVKDMLIRGGENVYPREVEEFLFRHPQGGEVPGLRRARPAPRRGGLRLDRAAARRRLQRGRDQGVLQGPDRPLQGAAATSAS